MCTKFLTVFLEEKKNSVLNYISAFKGIVSRDFGLLSLFIWIDMMFLIGPDQVYF
jgi:hypothetical protein